MALAIKQLYITCIAFILLLGCNVASAQTITAGAATGTIYACAGSASTSPNIEQFTIAGTGLTGNVTANAPANFEISLNPFSGYAGSINIAPKAGKLDTLIYVRSASTAPAGHIIGSVTVSSAGTGFQIIYVNGRINTLPTVNPISAVSVTRGTVVPPINFTGSGHSYTWTNNKPGIGLPASGGDLIPSFRAVNTTAAAITATITVTPTSPAYVYLPGNVSGNVVVINTITNKLQTVVDVTFPGFVHVTPDASKVYVENYGASFIPVISTATNTVIDSIALPGGIVVNGIILSPDGKTLYSGGYNQTVYVIDVATDKILRTIPITSGFPLGISPDNSKMYIEDNASDTSYSIESTADGTVLSHVHLPQMVPPSSEEAFKLSFDGTKFYIISGQNTIMVINAATGALISNITLGISPLYMTFSPDGSQIYVTDIESDDIDVISTVSNTVTGIIKTNGARGGAVASPDGSRLYVANTHNHSLDVVDLSSNSIIASIAAGPEPLWPDAAGGTGCTGAPISFTITVNNPATAFITAGKVSGSILACSGAASAAPYIQQFTVSGKGLTGDITVAAPAAFQVSLAADSGYGSNLALKQTAGKVNDTVIYVRSAATAPRGNISGNVKLTAAGADDQDVAVTGTINALLNPSVSISANKPVACQGTSIVYTAVADSVGNNPVYQWQLNGQNAGTNLPQFTSSALKTGDKIKCIVTATDSCGIAAATSNEDTVTVNPYITPHVVIAPSVSTPICSGTPLTFKALVTGTINGTSYQWQVNGISAGADSAVFSSSSFRNGDQVTCTSSINGLCTLPATSAPYTVAVNQTPSVSFAGDATIDEGGSVKLSALVAGNIASYNWSPASGLSNAGIAAPLAHPTVTTTYHLTVTTTDGCEATIAITVNVLKAPVIIPNLFTPNGDEINDTWNIKNLDTYPGCTVKIFNRQGSLVFQSKGYPKPWDGTFNLSPLPTGVYYYVIDLNDGTKPLGGSITLLR